MRPRLVFSPDYVVELGGHVFPTRKFALAASVLRSEMNLVEPELPAREDLLLAHTPEWADKVLAGRLSAEEETLVELPCTPEVSRAHRLSVSGTILACRQALAEGVGLHAGGGSHHAFADHGEGFCLLNDLAVGILKMRAEGRLRRAAVVDLDVHQGNGTAAIFAEDPSVFTLSVHQGDLYPEVKQTSSLDVELPAGTGDAAYLKALGPALERALAFKPDLVVYQAGVDCAEGDLLGGLSLSPEGLKKRDRAVRDACRGRGVPVAVTLGGGYAIDVGFMASLHAQTLRVFAGKA